MIESFKNEVTEDIFNGIASKSARKACPQVLWPVATRKLDQLDSVIALEELKSPLVTDLRLCQEIVTVNIVSELISNTAFALNGAIVALLK